MLLLKTLTTSAIITAVAAAGAATLSNTTPTDLDSSNLATMAKFNVKGKVDAGDAEMPTLPARLMMYNRPVAGAGGGSGFSGDLDNGSLDLAQEQSGRGHQRWKEVAKTKINSDGTFEFKNVDEGGYQVHIGDPEKTMWAMKTVRVKGKDIDAGTIKLNEPEGRQGNKRGKMGDGDEGGDDNDNGNSGGRRR